MLIEHQFGVPATQSTAALWVSGIGLTYDVVYDNPGTVTSAWDPSYSVPKTYVIDAA